MSLEGVQFIIGKAVTDQTFREQLKRDTDFMIGAVSTRHDYTFTDEEVEALKGMDWDGLEAVGHDLDQRVSRMRGSFTAATGTCDCTPTPLE